MAPGQKISAHIPPIDQHPDQSKTDTGSGIHFAIDLQLFLPCFARELHCHQGFVCPDGLGHLFPEFLCLDYAKPASSVILFYK
jgi:hypothetical protein